MSKVFLYRLDQDYTHAHPILARFDYANDHIEIKDGVLTIKKGYAWDGCTPKWQPFGLVTFGTPDGALRFGKPWLYHPSLVHDALCQFRHELPFTQAEVTQIWRDHLKRDRWPLWRAYTFAVNHFGPQDFSER